MTVLGKLKNIVLEEGNTYYFLSETGIYSASFVLSNLRTLLKQGWEAVVFSTINPNHVNEYSKLDLSKIYWLTSFKDKRFQIIHEFPSERIWDIIQYHLANGHEDKNKAIVFDDVISWSQEKNINATIRWLNNLSLKVSEKIPKCVVLVLDSIHNIDDFNREHIELYLKDKVEFIPVKED